MSIVRPKEIDYTAGLDDGIEGWRVGHIRHLYESDLPANDEVRVGMRDGLATLERLGARVQDVSVAPLQQYATCKATIQHAEIGEEYESVLARTERGFGEKLRARMLIGRDISAGEYLQAQRERRALTRAMHDLFARFDLLVTAGPYAPPPLISEVAANWSFDGPEITVPFSLTSVPALSLCVGFTRGGLPLSMQMIGPHLGDDRVLRAAQSYQAATPWHEHHPLMCRSEVATVL
jgi:aspartyl-tRNA(Asn)/glutamyl-tRNA(Gln) amidotransferase subunit A